MTRENAKLNEVYCKLLVQAKSQKSASSKIIAAEKAWVTYRDAYIEAQYPAEDKPAEYGTIYPVEVEIYLTWLTERHTNEMKELLRHYTDAVL